MKAIRYILIITIAFVLSACSESGGKEFPSRFYSEYDPLSFFFDIICCENPPFEEIEPPSSFTRTNLLRARKSYEISLSGQPDDISKLISDHYSYLTNRLHTAGVQIQTSEATGKGHSFRIVYTAQGVAGEINTTITKSSNTVTFAEILIEKK